MKVTIEFDNIGQAIQVLQGLNGSPTTAAPPAPPAAPAAPAAPPPAAPAAPPAAPTAPTAPAAPPAAPAGGPSTAELTAAFQAYAQQHGAKAGKAIMAKFGATKMSEIKPEHYATVMQWLQVPPSE